jgi:hypothetical protein
MPTERLEELTPRAAPVGVKSAKPAHRKSAMEAYAAQTGREQKSAGPLSATSASRRTLTPRFRCSRERPHMSRDWRSVNSNSPAGCQTVANRTGFVARRNGTHRESTRVSYRVNTMNSVPRPVSRPKPSSETTSDEPGTRSSPIRSTTS